jgi:RNA polymerase sigma factor (sigma-70 family)
MSSSMNGDAQCLEHYVREGSQRAFRTLVERYIALVNSTALRMTGGNVHLAQDVTQMVFADLARKAAALPAEVVLGGWLHRHTCYTALKTIRSENRRFKRERTAMEINALNDNTGQDAHWLKLAPVLDEALNSLATDDREVIVLRYFQQQDMRSVGRDLGTTETAAQKRLGRALEKLRAILIRRGVTVASATLLASTLDAGTVAPVPHGLVDTVSAHALNSVADAGLTFTSLKTMVTSKLSLLVVASVVAVAGVAAVMMTQNKSVAADSSVAAPASAVVAAPAPAAASPRVAAPVAPAQTASTTPTQSTVVMSAASAPTPMAGSTSSTSASMVIGTPDGAPTESHTSMVRINNGMVTSSTNDNGIVQAQTQALPASGVVSGPNFVASSGAMPPSAFPMPTSAPTSTRVNADGSTTSTYTTSNGGAMEVTVSADGNSRSMRSTSSASVPSN